MKLLSTILIFLALVIAVQAKSVEKEGEGVQMKTKEESNQMKKKEESNQMKKKEESDQMKKKEESIQMKKKEESDQMKTKEESDLVPVEIERRFWQNEYDREHYFYCPSGQSVRRIQSEHNNHREDRRWMWSCEADGAIPSSTHTYWSDYVNYWDRILNYKCRSGYVITGTRSYHDNHREDRRFKYRCSKIDESCKLTGCHHTQYLNALDRPMDFRVPRKTELFGLWSQHYNHEEDRIWMASICNIECRAPTYSVYSVDWDTSGISFGMKPQALSTQRIHNPTRTEVSTTVAFNEKRTISESTSWSNSFEAGVKWSAGVNVGIFSSSIELHLSYGYTHGGESTKITEKSFSKSFHVKVPAHTSVEVQLVVKKIDNAVIPFTATLKRVVNGKTTYVKKTGTWRGVLYSDDTVKVVPLGKDVRMYRRKTLP